MIGQKISNRDNDMYISVENLDSLSSSLSEFKVITVGKETKGFYIPASDFEEYVEDFIAGKSEKYRKKIQTARNDTQFFSLEDIKKEYVG